MRRTAADGKGYWRRSRVGWLSCHPARALEADWSKRIALFWRREIGGPWIVALAQLSTDSGIHHPLTSSHFRGPSPQRSRCILVHADIGATKIRGCNRDNRTRRSSGEACEGRKPCTHTRRPLRRPRPIQSTCVLIENCSRLKRATGMELVARELHGFS